MCVSIIIVNFNTKELLYNCLISIYKQTKDIEFEVIVSDNGSVDGSIKMVQTEFPKVIIIKNGRNIGFGAANNRGLDIAKGEYVFYLNSDTVLLNNAVKVFYDFWENYSEKDKLGAIGCNLLGSNFEMIHSAGNFPDLGSEIKKLLKNNIFIFVKILFHIFKYDCHYLRKIYFKKNKKNPYYGAVDYITGADLFLKNNNYARYDESFFLYYEETNLQYKLFLKGKRRLLIDGPCIQHFQGGSGVRGNVLDIYTSVPVIQNYISAILYFLINNKSGVWIIKLFTIIILSNPYFIRRTYKYIAKVIFLLK
jgi:GT2 family glycosyltransferase